MRRDCLKRQTVNVGETIALIGANGAGKSTFLRTITGLLRAEPQSVLLDGQPITGLAPEQIAMRGLVRTFQIVRPMHGMTVLENAMIGAFARTSAPALSGTSQSSKG